jgi:hypothetical protein
MKGIIIMGSAASGKTWFEERMFHNMDFQEPKMWFREDPDDFVESENSEFYNNPLAASKFIYDTVIPHRISNKWNFVLQNTGANVNTLRKIIETPNYQFKIVVVYCNPIISFKRNFSRERKLPKQIVLENWLKVYSNIEEYVSIVGSNNIYIYESEYTDDEENLIKYYNNKSYGFYEFISTVTKDIDTTSSFKKEGKEYSLEEHNKKIKQFKDICGKVGDKYSDMIKNIYDKFKNETHILKEISKWI